MEIAEEFTKANLIIVASLQKFLIQFVNKIFPSISLKILYQCTYALS